MYGKKLTRWKITREKRFEEFLTELIEYLKTTLVPLEGSNGQIFYTYTKDNDYDLDYMEPFERVANFCLERNLDPYEVIDMIDEYTDGPHNCECYLLEDEKILKLIGRPQNYVN